MISTGLKGLDKVITGLRKGDNVVWQIDDISQYRRLVQPFVGNAIREKRKLIYMRFAPHEALLDDSPHIRVYKLDAGRGFESFATEVNKIITREGEEAFYVFDCLSALLSAWSTDLMIGNFFMVTCPYLYELNTIAYFSILRNRHSYQAIARIRETTQLLMDAYQVRNKFYVHPLKVWNRYSASMFLPHFSQKNEFIPVTDSVNAARLLSRLSRRGSESAKRNLDYWDRLFMKAEELAGDKSFPGKIKAMLEELCQIMITRDEKILSLVLRNFSLEELINIKSRLVGTGLIGGKAVGMLLARKMLSASRSLGWPELVEPHDSFYIGSDVFYSYIVENRLWKLRMQQKTKEGYFEAAPVLKEKMLYGTFPPEIMERFQQMIEYFGASPIIIRSSSLLEDGFGNAFAGKYESVFCANQGTPEERYLKFAEAVRRIYASTMSEDALAYRRQRGLDKRDEQMALLVQRVSGSYHEQYFFPDVAGVGISYNTYVWNKEMDPRRGMLRVVCGLGTRAVNRTEGDYPRIAALDEPLRRPYADIDDVKKFSQHDIDLIDTSENKLKTVSCRELADKKIELVNFDRVLSDEKFTGALSRILKALERKYNYPVEIEFTVNFNARGDFKLNLLQCRPLQTKTIGRRALAPEHIDRNKILFETKGYFLGGNISERLKRIIYVDPAGYSGLALSQKYDIARIIGKLNRDIARRDNVSTLLIGPGRWGTTTPSLGVPVSFSEINHIAVLAETAFSGGNLMPELSFGTHFFQDLVETAIFYVALFPEEKSSFFNDKLLSQGKNSFSKYLPDFSKYEDVIRVYDIEGKALRITSSVLSQKVICFFE